MLFASGEIVQVSAGAYTVQLAPPGDAVIVYVVASPPAPVPGLTVTTALPSPATADGAEGIFGNAIVHCAVSWVLTTGIWYVVLAAITCEPSDQPAKL